MKINMQGVSWNKDIYLAQNNRIKKNNKVNDYFNNIMSSKEVDESKVETSCFEEQLKSHYPGAYFNVMDTSKIDGSLWGRNDYPWDMYFSEPAEESVLSWKPSGAEPSMQDSKNVSKINSMAGKMSVVIPSELEEKMKEDPKLRQQVMDSVDNFVAKYYRPEANQGFLITFDKDGQIQNACIACEGRITVSSSDFSEERKVMEAKRAEYNRIAMERVIRQQLLERERVEDMIDKSFYAKL